MEREIRDQLVGYLAGDVSPADLEAWLLAETWDLDEASEPYAAELAYSALLAISEHGHEHLSRPELRRRVLSLAVQGHLGTPAQSVTASSSSTHQARWALSRLAAAGTRSAAVSA
jgi:hypothetical protein